MPTEADFADLTPEQRSAVEAAVAECAPDAAPAEGDHLRVGALPAVVVAGGAFLVRFLKYLKDHPELLELFGVGA
jgi:hypothetical protein